MKKIGLLALLLSISLMSFAGERYISIRETPRNLQIFVNKHFSKNRVNQVRMTHGRYEVMMNNGILLEFHRDGKWIEAKTRSSHGRDKRAEVLPSKLVKSQLPSSAIRYLNKNYSRNGIVFMRYDRGNEFDIMLNNGVKLSFHSDGSPKYMRDNTYNKHNNKEYNRNHRDREYDRGHSRGR